MIAAVVVLAAALWLSHRHGGGSAATVADRTAAPAAPLPTTSAAMPADLDAPPDPKDPAGWRRLGEARFRADRYAAAVDAYQHAVALAPSHAGTWSALGEARVMASAHDPMPAEALKDFRQAAGIDPKEPRSRYFLAVARDLAGDHDGAIAEWLALLGDTPPGAPWEPDLRRTIEQVGRIHHIDVAGRIAALHRPAAVAPAGLAGGIPAPTDKDLTAASAIPPSQQQAMAVAMVARLEQRLAANPRNGEGWALLIRSRLTMDGPAAAKAALARAVVADPADAAQLREVAGGMGVK